MYMESSLELSAWLQMVAAFLQAAAAIIIVFVTFYCARITHKLLKVQIDPVIEFEVSDDQISILNKGIHPVVDLLLNTKTTFFIEHATINQSGNATISNQPSIKTLKVMAQYEWVRPKAHC